SSVPRYRIWDWNAAQENDDEALAWLPFIASEYTMIDRRKGRGLEVWRFGGWEETSSKLPNLQTHRYGMINA
ncbi:MAG TPA: hypothetical protein VJB60_01090, partial [Candidatus Peribacterales bacterium]|nr:hypothetical protein [Candidatus Peribacterales bacterium]